MILQCLISSLFLMTGATASLFSSNCLEPPKICPNERINFFLYTSSFNDLEYELNVFNDNSINEALFIRDAPIKFLIHGYTGHKDYAPNPQLRKAYFERDEPVNVISLHYKDLVEEGCYSSAVQNTDLVANCSAQFLEILLNKRPEISLDQIHIIGLSLGAQVAGQMHNYFHKGPFKRITGLDPAAPFFYSLFRHTEAMLSPDDAQFVDVLHTNAGLRGKLLPVGHVDFYANLGLIQPGCGLDSSCSHERAVDYYAESINSKDGFWAFKCPDFMSLALGQCSQNKPKEWDLYGEYSKQNMRGIYFFSTNRSPPYARGKQ